MAWLRSSVVTALLFVLYLVVFLPWGLIARGKIDPLHRRLDRTGVSYWMVIARSPRGD